MSIAFKDFKILKFGGTSVGSVERMQNVAKLITVDESYVYFSDEV
jgi:aspartokinase